MLVTSTSSLFVGTLSLLHDPDMTRWYITYEPLASPPSRLGPYPSAERAVSAYQRILSVLIACHKAAAEAEAEEDEQQEQA